MNHIMLDLETLGSGPRAAIVAIGAVKFSLETYELGKEFYMTVDPGEVGEIDWGTVRWWFTQPEEARLSLVKDNTPLPAVIQAFNEFCGAEPTMWGNGATFDNVIWRNVCASLSLNYPAKYYNDLCYRTMKNMFPEIRKPANVAKHNALADARCQALHLCEIMKQIRARDVINYAEILLRARQSLSALDTSAEGTVLLQDIDKALSKTTVITRKTSLK